MPIIVIFWVWFPKYRLKKSMFPQIDIDITEVTSEGSEELGYPLQNDNMVNQEGACVKLTDPQRL